MGITVPFSGFTDGLVDVGPASAVNAAVTRHYVRLGGNLHDALPCTEYRQEVAGQYAIAERLFYLQQCRSALEQGIASGASRLRFHWHDGHVTETLFRKTGPTRIRVSGLLTENPM